MTNPTLLVSESAAQQIAALQAKEKNTQLMLRVTVLGGGCSGFQYELGLDDTLNADDFAFERNGVKVVTDATSMQFLQNAEIDYVRDMMKSSFKIKNPNAGNSCGCGNSFSVRN